MDAFHLRPWCEGEEYWQRENQLSTTLVPQAAQKNLTCTSSAY